MSWVLMLGLGVVLMFAARKINARLRFLLIRIGGVAFLAAGWLLAAGGGWVAGLLRSFLNWIMDITDSIGSAAFGVAIVWMLVAALMIVWILAMLPDGAFEWDPPDWLLYAGLAIPVALAVVPGAIGDLLRNITNALASALTNGVAGAI